MKARFKSKKNLLFSHEHLTKLNIFAPINPRLHKATARRQFDYWILFIHFFE